MGASRPHDGKHGGRDFTARPDHGELSATEEEQHHAGRKLEHVVYPLLHLVVGDEELRKREVVEADEVGTVGELAGFDAPAHRALPVGKLVYILERGRRELDLHQPTVLVSTPHPRTCRITSPIRTERLSMEDHFRLEWEGAQGGLPWHGMVKLNPRNQLQ